MNSCLQSCNKCTHLVQRQIVGCAKHIVSENLNIQNDILHSNRGLLVPDFLQIVSNDEIYRFTHSIV